MRKLIGSFIMLLSFSCISSNTLAETGEDPSAYLEAVAKKMIVAVEADKVNIKTDPAVAEKLAREYLLPVINVEEFSKRTLGSKIWKEMSAEQQKTFQNGYINQVINKYAKGLSLYDGQDFVFEKAEISKKSGAARVKSSMKQSGSESLSIYYYLTNNDEHWLIYNIIVEGVNMTDSYSTQFLPRINEIGMDKFLKELSATETAKTSSVKDVSATKTAQ